MRTFHGLQTVIQINIRYFKFDLNIQLLCINCKYISIFNVTFNEIEQFALCCMWPSDVTNKQIS